MGIRREVDQRFYASTYGRFNTPDRFQGEAKGASDPGTPASWNKYAYTLGDPVNNVDPQGMYLPSCPPDGSPCGGPGMGWGWGPPCTVLIIDPTGCILQMPTGVNQPSRAPVVMSVSCSITLEWRPVDPGVWYLRNVNHDYLFITTAVLMSNGVTDTEDDVVEGLPQSWSYPFGNLSAKVWQNFTSSDDDKDNPWNPTNPAAQLGTDPHTAPLIGGASVCQQAEGLENAAFAFPSNIPYNPVPASGFPVPGGENGNWLVWSLLNGAGLNLGTPRLSPGWPTFPVPSL
jgi:RHS repeat-associated protein